MRLQSLVLMAALETLFAGHTLDEWTRAIQLCNVHQIQSSWFAHDHWEDVYDKPCAALVAKYTKVKPEIDEARTAANLEDINRVLQ